jgi:hypothetical protein
MPRANTSQLGLIRLGTAQLGIVEPNVSGGISGTAALTAAAATLTASGTIVNAYTGTSAVTAAAATVAATGTVVNPAAGFGSNFQLLGIG